MPRTRTQLEAAAARAADLVEQLDPDALEWKHAATLRALAEAVASRAEAEGAVTDAVTTAREAGMSWPAIAAMLGTSAQAARERYGPPRRAAG